MVSMMSVWESTEMPTYGNNSPNSLTTSLWLQSSKDRFSAFMEVCHQALIHLIRSDSWTECKKCLMKDPFAICYGQTLMTDADGASPQEELATHLDRTSQSSSIMQIIWSWYQGLISWSWTDIIGLTKGTLSLSSQLLTTVTDVEMRQPLWKLMSSWNIHSCSSTPHQSKLNPI